MMVFVKRNKIVYSDFSYAIWTEDQPRLIMNFFKIFLSVYTMDKLENIGDKWSPVSDDTSSTLQFVYACAL